MRVDKSSLAEMLPSKRIMQLLPMVIGMALVLMLLTGGVASAQTGTDSLNVDTLRLEVTSMVDTLTGNDLEVTVELWGYIDGQTLGSIEVGFDWLSSNMQMDSAKMSPVALTAFDFLK